MTKPGFCFGTMNIVWAATTALLSYAETATNLRAAHISRTSPSVGFCLQDAAVEVHGEKLVCAASSLSKARIASVINVHPKYCVEGDMVEVEGTAML